jgi:Family of unknown function (DUF6151)
MPADLPIRCSCGTLRGVVHGVSASRGNRVVCYCGDCQSFAHFLGRAGEVLDPHGGTDIFQTSPARLEITRGRERLACMRLTPKGLLRWYADCCRTPIGNTAITPEIPFCAGFDTASTGLGRDELLGPVRGHVNTGAAKADADGHQVRTSGALPSILRFARLALQARLRGDHKRSLFFEAGSGAPSVTPRVLTRDELRDVVHRRDAL